MEVKITHVIIHAHIQDVSHSSHHAHNIMHQRLLKLNLCNNLCINCACVEPTVNV